MTSRLLALLLPLLLLCEPCFATELLGQVVGVVNGDTIDVLTDSKQLVRVRLSGIDAPEKRQTFGQVAKRALSDLIFHRVVTVEWHKKDRYGRVPGKVLAGGQDANLKMVRQGMAWHYKKYQNEQLPADRLSYARAEGAARLERIGLWIDKEPTAPWEFRRPPR